MILLEAPYVSEFLIDTITRNHYTVIPDDFVLTHYKELTDPLITAADCIHRLLEGSEFLYTNSENAFAWVSKNLGPTSYPDLIDIFKDKARFRELIAGLYPEVFFKKVSWAELNALDKETFSYPLVLKPTVGFFSLGVNIVKNPSDWDIAISSLKKDITRIKNLYPEQVINVSDFIIESYIEGEEFAFDCYFNKAGEPVVLTVMKHLFSSDSDVGDRLYMTSVDIIVQIKDKVDAFLKQLGNLIPMSNFPLHIEVRLWKGKLIPIEVNPMRFGGWCTTADVTWYAYGFNSYEYFFNQRQPDWENILKREDRATYSIVILDIPATHRKKTIKGFDYEKLLTRFENPLELRKIDFRQHPVFGFLFLKTSPGNSKELEAILQDDLTDFIV